MRRLASVASLVACAAGAVIEVTAGGSTHDQRPTYRFLDDAGSFLANLTADSDGSIAASGDLKTDGSITASGDLKTDGNITASGDLKTDGNITASGDLKTGGSITASGDLKTDAHVVASLFKTPDVPDSYPADAVAALKSNSAQVALYMDGLYYSAVKFSRAGAFKWQIVVAENEGNKFQIVWGTGGVSLSIGANTWSSLSDMRLKHNWRNFEDARSKIATLTHFGSYESTTSDAGIRLVGLSAQEVQEVLPEAVQADKDGFLTLQYQDVFVLGLKATQEVIKEQHEIAAQLQALAATNARLEATNARLEATNAKFEARLAALEARLP